MAANPMGQTEMWTATENWINKQKDSRITLPESHKKFDHCQIWTQLPHLDFPKQVSTARTTQPDFSQRIDTVFFKRHVDEWKKRIETQIQGDLKENPTGQALADLIHKEQKILLGFGV